MFTFGYVSIVGKPNAGKSTLINTLIGEKVAIISNKPQTTRNNILGIKNGDNFQVVFIDTPGIHPSKNHLDKFMMKNVRTAIADVDLILYLIDASKPIDEDEINYIYKLKKSEINVMTVLTKSDKIKKSEFKADIEISSLQNKNLDQLFKRILDVLPKFESKNYVYDKEYFTDKPVRFLVAENIREAMLNALDKEIPHGVAVEIIKFEEKDKITIIEADIVCEKNSHKGIIIGKAGKTLKIIGQKAREESEKLLNTKILLKLFVKVEEDWRNKPSKLSNLGYNDNF